MEKAGVKGAPDLVHHPCREIAARPAFWHLADIAAQPLDVRFRGYSGHRDPGVSCPLMTQSGHRPAPHVAVATPVSALSMHSFEPIRCALTGDRHEAAGIHRRATVPVSDYAAGGHGCARATARSTRRPRHRSAWPSRPPQRHHLAGFSAAAMVFPIEHQRLALVEKVATQIGPRDAAPDAMPQRSLDRLGRICERAFLVAPRFERGAETMHRRGRIVRDLQQFAEIFQASFGPMGRLLSAPLNSSSPLVAARNSRTISTARSPSGMR